MSAERDAPVLWTVAFFVKIAEEVTRLADTARWVYGDVPVPRIGENVYVGDRQWDVQRVTHLPEHSTVMVMLTNPRDLE